LTTSEAAPRPAVLETLREAAEYLNQGISVFDADLRLVVANRRFSELYDLPEGFIREGMSFEEIIRYNAERGEYGPGDPEDQVRWRVKRASRFEAHHFERLRPDGRWLEIAGNPLPSGGFVTTYTDITDRVRAAEALRQANELLDRKVAARTAELSQLNSELLRENAQRRKLARQADEKTRLLQAIIDHLPQGISVFDNDMKLLVANSGFARLTDVPLEWCVPGTPFERFMRYNAERGEYGDGDVDELVRERVERAREMVPHEFERARPDGTTIEVRGNPVPGFGFLSTFTDVTARHRAEAILHESEATVRAMLDTPGVLLLLADAGGGIMALNDAAAQVLGHPKSALIGSSIFDHLAAGRSWRGASRARRALRRLEPVRFESLRDGRCFEVQVAPIVNADGTCGRMMIAAVDVTHRKEAEAQLLEAKTLADMANRAKTEFLANMSHELRTPLNAIIGFADVIAGEMFGGLGSQRYREYAEDIRSSGRHLLALINDILDISRIEIGAVELAEDALAPGDLVRSCVRLVAERAGKAGVVLEQRLASDLPTVVADERRLKQVLINLLSNAVKFTPPEGSVTVAAGRGADGGLWLSVTDTGIGMAPDEIRVALTPFRQVDTGLARRYEGAGLGLPLAKALTELHGGTMTIESTRGAGTAVTLRLPASRAVENVPA